ncbi:hypothetical protein VB715_17225 [Crocosphaera sp. UHCC 0190]|uniref:hypothetical protein n=1 Tax=Crocosphaera sp. UHCC 0190 TaxID=3110246 RepID=UPI002B1F3F92|nr:hypothetical protein [Crocosphaera sp. UHCC 0190]MEA5511517.1 hypothetical protein [Crocosphaera sp. UHCC 0190]
MYEDFNYITDNNFLTNYWWHEKVVCQKCKGNGKLMAADSQNMTACPVCHGTGKVQRHQQQDASVA